MHKDAAAKKDRNDDYHYDEPMPLMWFIALAVACAVGVIGIFMALVWIATA